MRVGGRDGHLNFGAELGLRYPTTDADKRMNPSVEPVPQAWDA